MQSCTAIALCTHARPGASPSPPSLPPHDRYQPAELARLNAWTSGGVEWNWPRLGHTVFTSAPVFMASVATAATNTNTNTNITTDDDDRHHNFDSHDRVGNGKSAANAAASPSASAAAERGPLVRVFEFDRELNTTYQVDVWLPANGSRTCWVHVKVSNPNPHPVAAYVCMCVRTWWALRERQTVIGMLITYRYAKPARVPVRKACADGNGW
jgi:hypothetical protein